MKERYSFPTDERKIPEFMQWLEEMEEAGKIEVVHRQRVGEAARAEWRDVFIKGKG